MSSIFTVKEQTVRTHSVKQAFAQAVSVLRARHGVTGRIVFNGPMPLIRKENDDEPSLTLADLSYAVQHIVNYYLDNSWSFSAGVWSGRS